MLAGIPQDAAGTHFRVCKGQKLFLAGVMGQDTLFWERRFQLCHNICPEGQSKGNLGDDGIQE